MEISLCEFAHVEGHHETMERRPANAATARVSDPHYTPHALVQVGELMGRHPVLVIDQSSRRILACNEAVEPTFGYTPEELRGRTTRRLHISKAAYRSFGTWADTHFAAGNDQYHRQFWMRRRDGTQFPSEHIVKLIHDASGSTVATVCVIKDLTLQPSGSAPDSSGADLDIRTLASHLPGAVFQRVITSTGEDRFPFVDGEILTKLGLCRRSINQDPEVLLSRIHPEDRATAEEAVERTIGTDGTVDFPLRLHGHDGNLISVRVVAKAQVLDDESTVWNGVALDLTAEHAAQERLHYVATHDELTGLINRHQFWHDLSRTLDRARATGGKVALLKVAVDRLLEINEAFGPDVGDRVLQEVARRLSQCVPTHDIVARSHGDLFLVALAFGKTTRIMSRCLDQIADCLRDPINTESGEQIMCRTRMGVARFPEDGDDADDLLRAAKVALERARSTVSETYVFYAEGIREQIAWRTRLEQGLYEALDKDELVPYFQPQFSLENDRLIGFEALIRWHRENGEVVAPGDFIPVAEETGLIDALGERMVQRVVEQIAAWRRAGLKVPQISINIPPRQLRSEEFGTMLLNTLKEADVPAEKIAIELTERTFMEDLDRTGQVMDSLAGAGVQFSIDDFGTGFSSLRYLAHLPLDILKIDRSFVSIIDTDERQRSIIEALVQMGRALGLLVIAEGAERPAQIGWLRHLKCEGVQGYFYGRPAPGCTAVEWISAAR